MKQISDMRSSCPNIYTINQSVLYRCMPSVCWDGLRLGHCPGAIHPKESQPPHRVLVKGHSFPSYQRGSQFNADNVCMHTYLVTIGQCFGYSNTKHWYHQTQKESVCGERSVSEVLVTELATKCLEIHNS